MNFFFKKTEAQANIYLEVITAIKYVVLSEDVVALKQL